MAGDQITLKCWFLFSNKIPITPMLFAMAFLLINHWKPPLIFWFCLRSTDRQTRIIHIRPIKEMYTT